MTDFIHIKISNSVLFAKIDTRFYSDITKYSWRVNHNGYMECDRKTELYKTYRTRRLHRIIFLMSGNCNNENLFKQMEVDHINHDTLDNRLDNLRISNRVNNSRNRRANKNNKSGYKGVSYDEYSKKYTVRIKVDDKNIYLGRFDCKHDAAEMYNKHSLEHFGEFAYLNKIER